MRRALLVMLVASCTLDPVGVLNRAALYVRAFDLPPGGELRLTLVDSAQTSRTKRAPVTKETMELLFEEGSLAEGPVVVSAELYDASGALVGCGGARGVVGRDEVVLLGFASPSSSALNCGTCGNRCETDVSAGVCVAGRCTGWECVPGLDLLPDGGCAEPVVVVPDAGPADAGPPDSGVPDAGGEDGGAPDGGEEDAGVSCTPSGMEGSEASCSDGVDNDCDGKTDCEAPGCSGLSRACSLGACGRMGTQAWTCTTRSWSDCAGDVSPEASTTACKDGVDNDCDGKTDCADESCNDISIPCVGTDICALGIRLWNCGNGLFNLLCVPHIPLPENNGLVCGNGLDDDCDGKIDCLDSLCRGRGCGLGKICCADGGCAASCD